MKRSLAIRSPALIRTARKLAKRSSWGIELNENSVCLVQLDSGRHGQRIARAASRPLANDAPFGEAASLPHWVEALRALKTSSRWSGTDVVASLPGHVIDTFPLKVEISEEVPIEVAVARQAPSHIPYEISEAVADYLEVDAADPRQGVANVILVATRLRSVEFALEVLARAGFTPLVLEMPTTALARLLHHIDPEATDAALVVNVADRTTSIGFIREGRLLVARVIPWGTALLVDEIAKGLGISADKAAHLLVSSRLNSQLEAESATVEADRVTRVLMGLVTPVLDGLVFEVEKVRTYSHSEFRAHPPRRILLSGRAASTPIVQTYLAANLPLPVSLVNPSRRFDLGYAGANRSIPPASLAVATGLALRGTSWACAN